MKTVKVTTNNTVSVIDIDFDNFREIQKTIGGHFETVHTLQMEKYFGDPSIIMLVDEEGLLKSLPMNFFGSRMYGLLDHGHPIVGDLILAKIVGEDITAPDDAELIKDKILRDFPVMEEDKNGTDYSSL